MIHVKRFNAAVRFVQENRVSLWYKRPTDLAVVALSDSAYKKERETAHALQGCLIGVADNAQARLPDVVDRV